MSAPHLAPPFTFAAGRHTAYSFGVTRYDPDLDRTVDFDLSASRYTVRLRAWASRDSSALLIDSGALTKTTTPTNWLEGQFTPGIVERAALFWECVLIDSNNAYASSPSGYLERRLFTFTAPVDPAPLSAAP